MGAGNVCLAIIRWLPVIFITAVVVWSYYAYVVQMCIFTVDNIAEKVLYLIFYHPFVVMFAWSYWKTIFTDVGTVPKEFYLSVSDVEQFEREENEEGKREILKRLARNLPVQCRTQSGAMRYCEKCKCIKPDRAHHCSVCGFCIQKMDHHCPWVNNCVSFTTYKFFVLFLGYALLYCLYVAATSLKFFIRFWTSNIRKGSGEFHVLFLFFAAVMFAISLISLFSYHMYLTTNIGGSDHELSNLHIVFVFFVAVMFSISLVSLLGYHIFLTCKNRSTLESFRAPVFRSGPDKDGFSLGCYGNFQEVFGDNKSYWFLPIFTSNGDGVNFPTRVAPTSSSYHSMETTTTTTNNTAQPSETTDATPTNNSQQNPNFGDGVSFPIRSVDEDYDSLLGQRQRWMEEGDNDGGGPVSGYDRQVLTEKM